MEIGSLLQQLVRIQCPTIRMFVGLVRRRRGRVLAIPPGREQLELWDA